jgi:hypothetical protein
VLRAHDDLAIVVNPSDVTPIQPMSFTVNGHESLNTESDGIIAAHTVLSMPRNGENGVPVFQFVYLQDSFTFTVTPTPSPKVKFGKNGLLNWSVFNDHIACTSPCKRQLSPMHLFAACDKVNPTIDFA